jgi:ribonuclease HI
VGLGWVIGENDYYKYVKARKVNSNNVAEYMALIRLLETVAAFLKPGDLRITGDSQLVICQILGDCRVNAKHIIRLHANAAGLIGKLTAAGWTVSLRWVDRSENTRADAASLAALVENGVEIAQPRPAPGHTPRFREMAEALEISSIHFGKVLDALGLRGADKMPTAKALKDGYAQKRFDGFRIAVDWQEEKTRAAVTAFLADRGNAAAIALKPTKPKSDLLVAQHLCGHETTVGRRPSRKVLAEVAQSLCGDCRAGDKVRFAAERDPVLALCASGDALADAVETVVADRRLRPGVFLACWGKWFHDQREKALDRYRGACEKPGLHPEF